MVTVLCVVIVSLLFVIYDMKRNKPDKVTLSEKKEREEYKSRETKHYSNLMNYNADKAYGGE